MGNYADRMGQRVADHLRDRHVDLDKHLVWVDEVDVVATFPLYTTTGKLVGKTQYRPFKSKDSSNDSSGRYYHVMTPGHVHFWGAESFRWSRTLFVTEGIFDAARITERGHSCLALLTCDPKPALNWLWTIGQTRKVVAICDPDDAGRKLRKYGHEYYTMQGGTDLGDAAAEEVDEILSTMS